MSEFHNLLERYLEGRLSDNELQTFLSMIPAHREEVEKMIADDLESGAFDGLTDADYKLAMYRKIVAHPQYRLNRKSTARKRWLLAAAACIMALTVPIGWLMRREDQPLKQARVAPSKNQVHPAGKNVILTLSDGTAVTLDSAKNGVLTKQGNTILLKRGNGQLAYNASPASGGEILYNTISTPKGVTYSVILPDSSEVMLNALSSIRFPTSFTDNRRMVDITGEVYFKVYKNSSAPFIVSVNKLQVAVLGTSFNINSYKDENAVRVTLLEGSVKVGTGKDNILLKPLQQAKITNSGYNVINNVDAEDILSWQKGLFLFKGQTLPEIMRQVSRWYDVEIIYEGAVTEKHFTGIVGRNEDISEILKFMQLAGIKFRINGKQIIVTQ